MKYRICIIAPTGYPHTAAFTEVAFLLRCSLSDLGHLCDVAVNEPADNAVNIILGYHLLGTTPFPGNCRYIAYQLEQLSDDPGMFPAERERILRDAEEVWDYSRLNISFLSTKSIHARYVPIGYHPVLRRIRHSPECDIDVLFYGSVNERRRRVLEKLAADGIQVRTAYGVYGAQRDELISRAKLVLNIHHYETQIFESVRVSYLLNNNCLVVSENSVEYPYTGVDLPTAPLDSLGQVCRRLLKNEAEAECARSATSADFARLYPMTRFLPRVVET